MPKPVKPNPEIYGRIVLDLGISNGAHRFWCYLAFRSGRKGYCWPSQRTIVREVTSNWRNYARWVTELTKAGYLKIVKDRKGLHYYPFPPAKRQSSTACQMAVIAPAKWQSGCLPNGSRTACQMAVRTNRKELSTSNISGAAPSEANGAPLSEAGKKALQDFVALKQNL
jgi:hypothetical protein